MLPKQRKVILDDFDELVSVTHDLDKIMEALLKYQILNDHMVNHLKRYYELNRRKREFYSMMLGRGPRAFEVLVGILRETENFRAEGILSKDRLLNFDRSSLEKEIVCPPIDELDIGPPKNTTNIEVIVKKHPDGKFMDCPVEGVVRGTYRMRSSPRGHAIIINIFKTTNHADRGGSDVDHRKLKYLFQQLGFVVFPYENLTDVEIRHEIAMRKTDPALANVDCLVVFIMCHGRQKGHVERSAAQLLASNDKPIDTNWLTREFQCPALKDKPKLFFFQACRTASEEKMESGTTIRYGKNIETDSELICCKESEPEADYNDTFLGFATLPGEVSMRDTKTGSWFVDAFCKVIAENAWIHELEDLWALIDNEISTKICNKGYQIPELVKRRFRKRLFFNPHLYE